MDSPVELHEALVNAEDAFYLEGGGGITAERQLFLDIGNGLAQMWKEQQEFQRKVSEALDARRRG